MSKFVRKFHHREWHKIPVVSALLDHWILPGEPSGTAGLRLAVRKNYVNFYRKGQAVAELRSTNRSLSLSVHAEYVAGTDKAQRVETKTGYRKFDQNWLCDPDNAGFVPGWIKSAGTFASAEKSYVDELVAANPATIDLEMALPASNGGKSAPRMDLVLIENHRETPCLAFWEAKCADNSEARARDREPEVVKQVRKYETWMAQSGRRDEVATGYQRAAEILLEFARAAGKETGPALDIWRRFKDAKQPGVIGTPGVAIGGYCPEGHKEKKDGKIQRFAQSFIGGGHKQRLEGFDLAVAWHETPHEAATPLPSLAELRG